MTPFQSAKLLGFHVIMGISVLFIFIRVKKISKIFAKFLEMRFVNTTEKKRQKATCKKILGILIFFVIISILAYVRYIKPTVDREVIKAFAFYVNLMLIAIPLFFISTALNLADKYFVKEPKIKNKK